MRGGTESASGLTRFLRLIRFSHTIFALPFALGALLVATHGRPSTMMTLSDPSWVTSQVPTIGSKVTDGLPAVSFERSIFLSAASSSNGTVSSRAVNSFI